MKPDVPGIDHDKTASPHAQEVEFALLISRMINEVKDDPSQMRLAIYEFARARLKLDASWADEPERERLAAALETAIQGVERFSTRQDDKRLQAPTPPPRIGSDASAAPPPSTLIMPIHRAPPAAAEILLPSDVYLRSEAESAVPAKKRMPIRLAVGVVLFALVAGFAFYKQWVPQVTADVNPPPPIAPVLDKPAVAPPAADPPRASAAETKTAAASSSAPPFPLPGDYGVYALNNDVLSELQLLPEQVPDKRVAMSTPINLPSRTTIPDGKAKFVVFRRDIVGNAPDRMEVRVVARVVRALTFDAKGKASFSPVSDAWNIRNKSFEFRVRPIAGNPEMLLIQPESADFALPPGRYVLVLKTQGYDFTVAGKVTDLSQCIERTDAANGAFYSECQKQP